MGAHPWALAQSVDAAEARWAWRRSGPSGWCGLVHAGRIERGGGARSTLQNKRDLALVDLKQGIQGKQGGDGVRRPGGARRGR